MIKSSAHKGLKEFYYSGSKKGIKPEHANRLGRMLDRLDASISAQDMNLPGYDLHSLKGYVVRICKRKLENDILF